MVTLEEQLAELVASGLEREPLDTRPLPGGRVRLGERELIDFCSNDYLGLAGDPALTERLRTAALEWGVGSRAARLLSGSRPPHSGVERSFAALMGKEDALLFNSGYQANSGILPALCTSESVILSDAHNHASIVDGCRLAAARVVVYPHRDLDSLEEQLHRLDGAGELAREGPHFLVTEGLFSMDGDLPDPARLVELKRRYGLLLYVDDAHGFGVLGPRGRGAFAEWLDEVDVAVVTFGKAAGVFGAAVAGSRVVVRLVRSRARSFIFSTALPPALVAALEFALERLAGEPGASLRETLAENAGWFRERLAGAGLDVGGSESHIVPVILGSEERAVQASAALVDQGLFCRAIRYPTVPLGEARLRFSLSAAHRRGDLEHAAKLIIATCQPLQENHG